MAAFLRRFFIVFAILGALRLALPMLVEAYVNSTIDGLEGYDGEIVDLDMNLWRGAYEIEGLRLVKEGAPPEAEPFAEVRRIDLSIQWAALLRGQVVGEVVCHHPVVSFVNVPPGEDAGEETPPPEAEQTGEGATWTERLDQLFPFRINRFVVRDGEIRWTEAGEEPVDFYMTDFFAEALNISNVRGKAEEEVLLAEVEAAGRPFGAGEFEGRIRFDPLAERLRFELDATVRHVDVLNLNDFFQAYGTVDAEAGVFSAYAEFAASDGRVRGYVKPLFENLALLRFGEIDGPEDALELFWEGMVAIASEILTNPPEDRLGTRIVLEGRTDQANADVFQVVGALLRNAFIAALRPAIDESVELRDLEIVVEESGEPGAETDDRAEER